MASRSTRRPTRTHRRRCRAAKDMPVAAGFRSIGKPDRDDARRESVDLREREVLRAQVTFGKRNAAKMIEALGWWRPTPAHEDDEHRDPAGRGTNAGAR